MKLNSFNVLIHDQKNCIVTAGASLARVPRVPWHPSIFRICILAPVDFRKNTSNWLRLHFYVSKMSGLGIVNWVVAPVDYRIKVGKGYKYGKF